MSVRRGLVLGCGGTLGAAWTVGVLHVLQETLDWDPRSAEVIVGTSAGAEYGAMLAGGVGVDEMLAAQRGDAGAPDWLVEHLAGAPGLLPPVPLPVPTAPGLLLRAATGRAPLMTGLTGLLPRGRDRDERIRRLGERLAGPDGWVSHPALWLVAVDLADGGRTAFGRPDAPPASLADALCASWCVPGWYPPVKVGGRRYVDGGAASTASADLLIGAGLDEVIVIAPMASSVPVSATTVTGRLELVLRRAMSRRLDDEIDALRSSGTDVRRLDMNAADLAVAGGHFMDDRRRRDVLEQSITTHRELLGGGSPVATPAGA
jgi:NTE family protein